MKSERRGRAGKRKKDGGKGLVFDIQRFSLHDGYGIRTLVFMKGCPLRCEWCSNPESQKGTPEVMFYEDNCIGCRECIAVCPFGESLRIHWPVPRELCLGCGKCVEVCYAEARRLAGRLLTVEEVVEVVGKDRVFYRESGGGITVGGGEPTYQAPFVAELLRRCAERGIHTAIETCGFAPWERLGMVLEHTDLLLFDIKHLDSEAHRRRTGVGNERILENARRASRVVKEMILRLPLIPGFNDAPAHIRSLGAFMRDRLPQVKRIDVLPYHSVGESKCLRLARTYALSGLGPLTGEKLLEVEGILKSFGLNVVVGG